MNIYDHKWKVWARKYTCLCMSWWSNLQHLRSACFRHCAGSTHARERHQVHQTACCHRARRQPTTCWWWPPPQSERRWGLSVRPTLGMPAQCRGRRPPHRLSSCIAKSSTKSQVSSNETLNKYNVSTFNLHVHVRSHVCIHTMYKHLTIHIVTHSCELGVV